MKKGLFLIILPSLLSGSMCQVFKEYAVFLVVISSQLFFLTSCQKGVRGISLELKSSESSGVVFSNDIVESDTFNYFNFPYIYMGGGVAIGDLNNDSLSDILFTGNMVSNRLYLNTGDLEFKDITKKAGLSGDHRWYTGVTMADINSDGWMDIYLSVSGKENTRNELYINNGDLTFTESATLFGIDDKSPSIQSTFFDFDRDGDLDLFVGNYPIIPLSLGNEYYFNRIKENEYSSSSHLYRNNGDQTFTDVTAEAGVQNFGLTLGVLATDLNNDGWQDLYISNDFQVPDHLYINNADGTFSDRLSESVQHTSMFGMGIDAADFTNDGLLDLVQLDMAPDDHRRAKVNMASMNPDNFREIVDFGGHYQYMQNSLQTNNGISDGIPIFSEISRFSGVSTTDWSWGVLFVDLDNDTNKDLIITNGIRRDINNNDVLRRDRNRLGSRKMSVEDLPGEALNNYLFQNSGEFIFHDVSTSGGFGQKGFSNGLAYGDLDNDGDLDIVTNNLDAPASIFENKHTGVNHYVDFQLIGSGQNRWALGARILIRYGNDVQLQELTLSRGFQSSVDPMIHFGLGPQTHIDEVEITWPDGSKLSLEDVEIDKTITIKQGQNNTTEEINEIDLAGKKFKDIALECGVDFRHTEDLYDDFEVEPLLPHKNSHIGPSLAVGDINADGLGDFFIGNATGNPGSMYVQQENLTFELIDGPWQYDKEYEDTGATFFDVDNDGDKDLYVVSGGNNVEIDNFDYQDRLYLNEEGTFVKTQQVLPQINISGKVVIAEDYDLDGDMDLFVGGRIVPGHYPYPATSHILRNESHAQSVGKFSIVTESIAPQFVELGLVTSAIWEDFNDDGRPDLIVTGEWMAIKFFANNEEGFEDVSDQVGMSDTKGWWYSLKSVDMDGDGDNDIVAGNLGLNYKYKTSSESPFRIYANDFDENGKEDIVLSYVKKGKQLPVRGRECSSQQVPAIGKRFKTFEAFADADLVDIYGSKPLKNSLEYQTNTFAHVWLENDLKEAGKYIVHQLPNKAQFSAINAIEVFDIDSDENPDLLIAGNLLSAEVETPRNDAGVGLVIVNSGKSDLKVQNMEENDLLVRGEVKHIRKIDLGRNGREAFLFAINDGSLKLMAPNLISKSIVLQEVADK